MDADLPSISVVTPSLNQRAFITETIESVLGQGYPNLEYLVVDGGSTDGTIAVLASYGERVRWVSERDAGQAQAINKGWRMTSGEIVSWLNADDTLLPGALAAAGGFLREHPEVAVVYGDCDYVDRQGQVVQPFPTGPFDYQRFVRSTVNFIPQPSSFVRRAAVEASGFLDEALHYVMDHELWLRLGLRHQLAYLPRKLARLRLHSEAKTSRESSRFPDEVLRMYQRFFARPDLPAEVRAAEAEAMSNVYYLLAQRAFLAGRYAQALRWMVTAWKRAPGRARAPSPLACLGGLELPFFNRWSPRRRVIP